ncbi:MAG: hypothetical protein ACI9WO_002105, partial [Sphingobacteriales bacterium]
PGFMRNYNGKAYRLPPVKSSKVKIQRIWDAQYIADNWFYFAIHF